MDYKKCSKCGEIKCVNEFSKNGKYLNSYCKKCQKQINIQFRIDNPEYKKNYSLINKDYIKEQNKLYRKNNNLKRDEYNKIWKKNNYERFKLTRSKRNRKIVENINDEYVIDLLRQKRGFTTKQIKQNPELIEIQRLIIKTKRLCKTSQN